MNRFTFGKRHFQNEKQPVPPYIDSPINKFTEKGNLALAGKLEHPFHSDDNKPEQNFDFQKSIKKQIYILIDAAYRAVRAPEFNTLVKRVGERTGGYIHFGNNGIVVLKHSGVLLHMAVSFNSYRDGRFLEEKGITPDIIVPPGHNALDYAIDNYKRSKLKHDHR